MVLKKYGLVTFFKELIIFIYSFIYISSSINPLQGQRPTGCGSSQGTLNSYREYY